MSSHFSTSEMDGRDRAILDAVKRSGVPSRFCSAEPRSLQAGRWAYITGITGSGKTHYASGLLRAFIEENIQCHRLLDFSGNAVDFLWSTPYARFTTARKYLEHVKAAFSGDDTAYLCKTTPFLVIDDLGQEVPTQWAVGELFDLIDYRYGEELPTVITSQFSRSEIARRLAQNGGKEQALALGTRLSEVCDVIDLGDVNRRLKS